MHRSLADAGLDRCNQTHTELAFSASRNGESRVPLKMNAFRAAKKGLNYNAGRTFDALALRVVLGMLFVLLVQVCYHAW